jgi:hypothetical protein
MFPCFCFLNADKKPDPYVKQSKEAEIIIKMKDMHINEELDDAKQRFEKAQKALDLYNRTGENIFDGRASWAYWVIPK